MKIHKITILDNGLKIITSYAPQSEGVCVSLWLRAGSRYENKDEYGFSHLFEHLLFSGNSKYKNNFEIASAIEGRGAKINGTTGLDYIFFDIESVIEYVENAFDVLSHLILTPLLKEKDLEKDKEIVLREINRNKDNHTTWVSRLAYMKNFEGHPLANNPLGFEESVLKADITKLKNYYKKFFVPERAALIVAGGLTHLNVEKLAEKYFGKWYSGNDISSEINIPLLPRKKECSFFEKREIKETHIRFNYLIGGVNRDEDNAALEIIADYLGYGMSSFLNQELREKRKLVYSISSQFQIFSDAGIFGIGTSTNNPEEVIHIVKGIMENLEQYLAKQNIEEMKTKMINLYKLQGIDPLYIRTLGRGFILRNTLFTTEDYISIIKNVTKKQLIKVSKEYLSPNNLLIVSLGPETK